MKVQVLVLGKKQSVVREWMSCFIYLKWLTLHIVRKIKFFFIWRIYLKLSVKQSQKRKPLRIILMLPTPPDPRDLNISPAVFVISSANMSSGKITMRPFGGMFQCFWDSDCKSLAVNALWQRTLVKKERKGAKGRWWCSEQWMVLGEKDREKKSRVRVKQVHPGAAETSCTARKTSWLFCLKTPKYLSLQRTRSILLQLF